MFIADTSSLAWLPLCSLDSDTVVQSLQLTLSAPVEFAAISQPVLQLIVDETADDPIMQALVTAIRNSGPPQQ